MNEFLTADVNPGAPARTSGEEYSEVPRLVNLPDEGAMLPGLSARNLPLT